MRSHLHGGTVHQTQETLDLFGSCLAAAPGRAPRRTLFSE